MSLMHKEIKIAERSYNNNVHDFLKCIHDLVNCTPENNPYIVDIEIAPLSDYQGGAAEKIDTIHLFEEKLSDKSSVYRIEVY